MSRPCPRADSDRRGGTVLRSQARRPRAAEPARPLRADALRQALTFHASFDGTVDAIHAAGNPRLYSAPSLAERQEAKPGLPASGETSSRRRRTLRRRASVHVATKPPVYFEAARNMAYEPENWNGTRVVLAERGSRDGAGPRFLRPRPDHASRLERCGVLRRVREATRGHPVPAGRLCRSQGLEPAESEVRGDPADERPLVTVEKPPFARGKWTHVVFTFERFNTGQPDGLARLYLDGRPAGNLSPRLQTFTWDPDRTAVALGLSYIGLLDELSMFNRALTPTEVEALHGLAEGVPALLR